MYDAFIVSLLGLSWSAVKRGVESLSDVCTLCEKSWATMLCTVQEIGSVREGLLRSNDSCLWDHDVMSGFVRIVALAPELSLL